MRTIDRREVKQNFSDKIYELRLRIRSTSGSVARVEMLQILEDLELGIIGLINRIPDSDVIASKNKEIIDLKAEIVELKDRNDRLFSM